MQELVFEITQESDGGFVAECLTEAIFTQANSWEELRANVKEAVDAFYFDSGKPPRPCTLRPRCRAAAAPSFFDAHRGET